MPHGLSDEQIRELSQYWAIFDYVDELYRFLTAAYSPSDLSHAVEALLMHLDSPWEFVDEHVRRSIYRSLIDAIPQAGPGSVSMIVRMIPRDPDLQIYLARVLGDEPVNSELTLHCFTQALASFVAATDREYWYAPVDDPDPDRDPEEDAIANIRAVFSHLAKATERRDF